MTDKLIDLLTEFDEMGYIPTTFTENAEQAAIDWKNRLVAAIEADNAELMKKISQLEEQLKAISDRTACLPSLEQIKKRFLDWAIPFLKARITGCKEEWFGIEWIAEAIWEFIKDGFENAIAIDETNAALRERLDKAVELPCINEVILNKSKRYQLLYKRNGRIYSTLYYDFEKSIAEERLKGLKGEKE